MNNKHIIYTKPGNVDVLKMIEAPVSVLNSNEVLVQISAAGVAYGDILLRTGVSPGAKFPITPGYDIVGKVVATGPHVHRFKAGDYVRSYCETRGYSTYICLPESKLVMVPTHLKPPAAVSVILNYTTAYDLLIKIAKLKKGDTALIYGAAGGVGTAMLQLAKVYGIKIFGSVSTSKIEVVEKAGGIPIDYTQKNLVEEIKRLTGSGVDAVFDPIAGSNLYVSNKVLNKNGTLVLFGASSAVAGNGNAALKLLKAMLPFMFLKITLNNKHYKIAGKKTDINEDIALMFKLLAEGKITPLTANTFPLKDAAKAQIMLENDRPAGKIVLDFDADH